MNRASRPATDASTGHARLAARLTAIHRIISDLREVRLAEGGAA
jgi:hypothetical protein